MDSSAQAVVGIALVALLPVAAFIVLKPAVVGLLSAGCVVVITASLYRLFGPVEELGAPIAR